MGLFSVNSTGIRNQASYGFSMPCDHNFFATFYPVEEGTESVLGFERADLHWFQYRLA